MDAQAFWQIVAASRRKEREKQLEALRAELSKLAPSEIAEFLREFKRQMQRSYSWDLWGAAYILNGGCSDDGFDYFRAWLISLGRETFEKAVADSDSLADAPEAALALQDEEGLFFEEFAYVADEVHEEKTGRAVTGSSGAGPERQPTGVPWEESPKALAKRFPRLWARFGDR